MLKYGMSSAVLSACDLCPYVFGRLCNQTDHNDLFSFLIKLNYVILVGFSPQKVGVHQLKQITLPSDLSHYMWSVIYAVYT